MSKRRIAIDWVAWRAPARWVLSVALALAALASWQGLLGVQRPAPAPPPGGTMGLVRLAPPAPAPPPEPTPPASRPRAADPAPATPVGHSPPAPPQPSAAPPPPPPAVSHPPTLPVNAIPPPGPARGLPQPAPPAQAVVVTSPRPDPPALPPTLPAAPPARPPAPPAFEAKESQVALAAGRPPAESAPAENAPAESAPAESDPVEETAPPVAARNSPATEGGGSAKAVAQAELDEGFGLLAPVLPSYPPQARRLGRDGKVKLELAVDPQGRVRRITILEETAGWGFGAAAQAAYGRARFSPPTLQGRPVWVLWRKTLLFAP